MKKIFVIAAGLLTAALLLGLWVQMAGTGSVPANKMAGKPRLLQALWPFIIPAFGAVVMLAMGAVKYKAILQTLRSPDLEKSDFTLGLSLLFGPLLAFVMQSGVVLYMVDLAGKDDLTKTGIALAFVFFLAMGNYIGTTKRGSPAGLRTPWSMHNDRIWMKTQRFLGRGLVLLSLIGFVALFFDQPKIAFLKFFVAVISLNILAAGYSYVLWRREKHQPV